MAGYKTAQTINLRAEGEFTNNDCSRSKCSLDRSCRGWHSRSDNYFAYWDESKNDFVNEQFPVRIKGFINSPSFRPDIEEIFRLEVEKTIQRRTQFLEKNIQKRSFNNLTPPQ